MPIHVVPHELIIDGKAYCDGVDIHPNQFYQLLKEGGREPTTSAPKPATFLDIFYRAAQSAESILCLTLSARFSSANDSAQLAAQMAREHLPGKEIRVLDSGTAAGAEGFIALEAARCAMQGGGLEQVTARAEQMIPKVHLLAFLDTLHYLGKSGRIPKVAAWAGSLIGLKPLMELKMGEARLIEKPRSRARAMERLLSAARERVNGAPAHVNVMHANAPGDAAQLKDRVEAALDCCELFISEFTPVMGAHTGPGLLGLAFYSDS